jgi:hypothetical protein
MFGRTSIIRSRRGGPVTGEPKNADRSEKINDDGEESSMQQLRTSLLIRRYTERCHGLRGYGNGAE